MGIENILYSRFLNAIYQEAKAMIQTFDDLIKNITKTELQTVVAISQRNFTTFANECEVLATAEKLTIKDNSWLDKASKWTTDKLAVLTKKTNSSLAIIIMERSATGAVECDKIRAEFVKVDKSLDELVARLKELFENTREIMNDYI